MNDRIKAIMDNAENLHIAYEENKEFYKAGFNAAIEAVAQLSLADRQNPDVIRKLKK